MRMLRGWMCPDCHYYTFRLDPAVAPAGPLPDTCDHCGHLLAHISTFSTIISARTPACDWMSIARLDETKGECRGKLPEPDDAHWRDIMDHFHPEADHDCTVESLHADGTVDWSPDPACTKHKPIPLPD